MYMQNAFIFMLRISIFVSNAESSNKVKADANNFMALRMIRILLLLTTVLSRHYNR